MIKLTLFGNGVVIHGIRPNVHVQIHRPTVPTRFMLGNI